MNLERYPVRSNRHKTRFDFVSEGDKGRIRKVILFQETGPGFYNLGFGDWDKKKKTIDSQIRSNNGDRDKILATVAFSVFRFFNHNEDAVVRIIGQTKARTRLYQMAINKYLNEISLSYDIIGIENETWEEFRPGKNYERFVLSKKRKL